MFSQKDQRQRVDAAPLDPTELARSLAPFGTSRMLPRAAYLDPDVLSWERRHVFGGWLCLGRSKELPVSPVLKAVSLGSSVVLLSREAAGVLRGAKITLACQRTGSAVIPGNRSFRPSVQRNSIAKFRPGT